MTNRMTLMPLSLIPAIPYVFTTAFVESRGCLSELWRG